MVSVFLLSLSQEINVRNQIYKLIEMLNFCKKMFFFYPFLGFSHSSSSSDHDLNELHRISRIFSPENCCSGLSLLVGSGGKGKDCRNILESSSIKPPKSVVNNDSLKKEDDEKKEILKSFGLCNFLDEKKDGLRSCTESLGFESSDQMEEEDEDGFVDKEELRVRLSWRRRLLLERVKHRDELMKNQIKKFPPPLSSLNQNGKPNFFLKPVRKDGRLELTEVPIHRPNGILRASRQDGRLRLHLVAPAEIIEEEEDDDETEEVEEVIKESEIQELKFPLIGDGFRRCQEIGNRRNQYHHHHHLPIWKQHQVTTRSTVHVL